MDKNIDPTIAESTLFQSLNRSSKDSHSLDDHSIVTDGGNTDDSSSIRNVFRLNQYVSDGHPSSSSQQESTTAAAALNMIQYNGFEHQHEPTDHSRSHNIEGLNAGTHYDFTGDALLNEGFLLEHEKPTPSVKMVQYNPKEKTKRLGRPRKHISKSLTPPEDSSSQNFNEAILSKFRLDTLPVEGPGSRGGRKGGRRSPKGRVTSGSIRKRKQQALLDFSIEKDSSKIGLSLTSDPHNESPKPSIIGETNETEGYGTRDLISGAQTVSNDKVEYEKYSADIRLEIDPDQLTEEISGTEKLEKRTPPNAPKPKILKRTTKKKIQSKSKSKSKLTTTSRTTVLNNRQKATKQLAGPLMGLYYDLYDDNVIHATQNKEAASEKIALGFPILKSPYAKDIVFIISFLNKFKDFMSMGIIGPQDIEHGLSLPLPALDTTGNFINKIPIFSNEGYNPDYVSPLMNQLFLKLLGLVLNRKKEVTSQASAISELKSIVLYLGLPVEWRDDSTVFRKIESSNDLVNEPVDESKPEIHLHESPEYHYPNVKFNPFTNPKFESSGLKFLEPVNRLILIRSLISWSLNTSDQIRNFVNKSVREQDYIGEKESVYVARSVARGFKNCEDSKREADIKISKRKNDENELKYVDPTLDPSQHSMSLRLNELFAGDCGFHIGRFYLCRQTDGSNCGISSVKQMQSMLNDSFSLGRTSDFKLYVEDVHQMLLDALGQYGVEFDSAGNEIEMKYSHCNNWYEVASNSTELKEFLDFLSIRLGTTVISETVKIIPKTSMIYKPILNLHNYLSWVLNVFLKQNSVHLDSRTLRKKDVDYNERKGSKELKNFIDEEEEEEDDDAIDYEGIDDDEDYQDEEDLEKMDEYVN